MTRVTQMRMTQTGQQLPRAWLAETTAPLTRLAGGEGGGREGKRGSGRGEEEEEVGEKTMMMMNVSD